MCLRTLDKNVLCNKSNYSHLNAHDSLAFSLSMSMLHLHRNAAALSALLRDVVFPSNHSMHENLKVLKYSKF